MLRRWLRLFGPERERQGYRESHGRAAGEEHPQLTNRFGLERSQTRTLQTMDHRWIEIGRSPIEQSLGAGLHLLVIGLKFCTHV
jgi:hypothetical protein